MDELREAAKGTASQLWKCIHLNEALGYLATKEINSKVLYEMVKEHVSEVAYSYANFRKYRNK